MAAEEVTVSGETVRHATSGTWSMPRPRNQGKLVSKRQLLKEVWGPRYQTETEYLRVYLAALRRLLEPTPRNLATSSPSRGWATASGRNSVGFDP